MLWLPIREPDIAVGPELFIEPLTLCVAPDHPLAGGDQVTLEDLGDYPVVYPDGPIPDYMWESHTPSMTPSGRLIVRGVPVASLAEALTAVSGGAVVSPIGVAAAETRVRHDVTFIPILDQPPLRYAPAWRGNNETPLVRAFLQAAADAAV
jgi:DNA-binding transcriptional LysR family regulator